MNNSLKPDSAVPRYLPKAPNTFFQKYWERKCELQLEKTRNDNEMAEILLEMRRKKLLSKEVYGLMKMRFFEGCVREKVGKYYGWSSARVQQLEEWALYRMNEYYDTGRCDQLPYKQDS
jgi:DNA-directed RNA polymerase specialized sigma subunit